MYTYLGGKMKLENNFINARKKVETLQKNVTENVSKLDTEKIENIIKNSDKKRLQKLIGQRHGEKNIQY